MAEPTELFERPYNIVSSQVDAMSQRADDAITQANGVMNSLTSEAVISQVPEPPAYSGDVDEPQIPAFSGTAPSTTLFGGIDDPNMPADPGDGSSLLGGIDFSDIEDIGDFTGSVNITIPDAPAPIDTSGAPAAPTLDTVTLPDEPAYSMPTLDDLQAIDIPEFTFPTLPTFDAAAPTFDATAPDTALDYTETPYSSENLDEVKSQIHMLMQGGAGIPAAVEEAIFSRTVDRADKRGNMGVQQAFDDHAARGWDMPAGMLNARVDAAREEQAERVSDARRDIMIQAAQWEIENLRFAVENSLAIERVLTNVFDNAAQRALRMAELRQQADLQLYNIEVELFNARQQAFQVQADVYRTKLQGALSELDVFRAQIEGEQAKAQVNEQVVRAFQAKVDAVRSHVEIYRARMSGAEIQASIQGQKIEQYKASVDAWGEKLRAEQSRFDAYGKQVDAERAKASVLESEARAFSSTVDAQRNKVNLRAEQIRARLGAVDAATQQYVAKVQAERDTVAAKAQALRAQVEAYSADVRRYSAEVEADASRKRLQQQVVQDKLRNSLAFYDTQVREYDAVLSRIIQEAQVKVDAVSSAGRMASQLAAGAMSAMNVGATLSGSANQSVVESFNY